MTITGMTRHASRTVAFIIFLIWPFSLFSQNIDVRLLKAFNSSDELRSDGFFRFVSNSEIYVALGIPAGLAVEGLKKDDKDIIREAAVMLVAEAVTAGITEVLKYSVNRERPFSTYPDISKKASAGSPSFPSGHTSNAFAAATSISLSYPKWYVIVPSYLWAGTVGFSRMDLGVHYPSDVLAGAVIGSGTAYKINQKLNPPRRKIKPCNCPRL
jgi:membrane-associated phospholipid phosphatase